MPQKVRLNKKKMLFFSSSGFYKGSIGPAESHVQELVRIETLSCASQHPFKGSALNIYKFLDSLRIQKLKSSSPPSKVATSIYVYTEFKKKLYKFL